MIEGELPSHIKKSTNWVTSLYSSFLLPSRPHLGYSSLQQSSASHPEPLSLSLSSTQQDEQLQLQDYHYDTMGGAAVSTTGPVIGETKILSKANVRPLLFCSLAVVGAVAYGYDGT
jgi:hypothetical protein